LVGLGETPLEWVWYEYVRYVAVAFKVEGLDPSGLMLCQNTIQVGTKGRSSSNEPSDVYAVGYTWYEVAGE